MMNNIDIAKLFLKIIRIKGKISYNNAKIIIQELILQYADNQNINPYYDILYPLSICGLIEYSDNYWYISPSIIIKYTNGNKFINNTYFNQEPIIDNFKNDKDDNIKEISIKKYEKFLYNFPNIYNVKIYTDDKPVYTPDVIYNDVSDEKIESIMLCNNYDIIRDKKEKFGTRYVVYNYKPYQLYDREKNPDSILYARINRIKNTIIKENNIIKIYKTCMPITLGRILFILSNNKFEDVFNEYYIFKLEEKHIKHLKKILGVKNGYK